MPLKEGGEEIRSVTMDHHGIVASVCKDLGLAEKIDARISNGDKRRVLSPGKAVVAMILNGLGFTNRRLYLTHQFFESKPIERLLDQDISSRDITDHTLGHTLDEIADYGSSQLFAEVAFETAIEHKLLGQLNHLDTTSFTVHGEYEVSKQTGEPQAIEVTYGHSKDHRPDLKQVVLSLVVNGPSAIPLFMEPLDGNNSDKKSFHETIEKVKRFQKEINLEKNFKWIADSALYTKEKLLKLKDTLWLTRVPETIKEAKNLVSRSEEEIEWRDQEKGYKIASFSSSYGSIEQRWLLVYSDQAYQREKKTFEKNLEKKVAVLNKAIWHLGNEVFESEKEAKSALKKLVKKYNLYRINGRVIALLKYAQPGKPKVGEEKIVTGYQIEATYTRNTSEIEKILTTKGRFILATNDLDKEKYTDEQMLLEYKEQQNVEGGFRFLKDPWFMVDSIFLKSPRRIESLMMVMTLCLMVYNIAQYKLRKILQEKKETLPNQLGKEIKNPTMRWIFQLMEGIGIVRFYRKTGKIAKEVITNLSDLRKKIICLFGNTAIKMYGLVVT